LDPRATSVSGVNMSTKPKFERIWQREDKKRWKKEHKATDGLLLLLQKHHGPPPPPPPIKKRKLVPRIPFDTEILRRT
jgi:hypothetical protein